MHARTLPLAAAVLTLALSGPAAHAGLFQDLGNAFKRAAEQVKTFAKQTQQQMGAEMRKARKALRKMMRDAGQAIIAEAKKVGGPAAKQALHGPFHAYIEANRISFLWRAKPLRKSEKKYLYAFFPKRIVDGMRVLERNDTGYFNKSAGATTFGADFVIIRRGQRSNRLLRHELVHACQYDRLGVRGFAHAYADQYVDGGFSYRNIAFEKQAYAFEKGPIKAFLGYCE